MADVGDVGDVAVTNFKKVADLADFSAKPGVTRLL